MDIDEKFVELHRKKFILWKTQNPEIGRFDVIFEIEGKLLYAHKNMLTLESETFDTMLSDRWMKNKDEPIKIKDYSYDNFYQFIIFLYTAQCELTDENIFSMVDIAEFYGVQLFKEFCEKYLSSMEITIENVFQLIDMAENFTITRLQTRIQYFIANNFTDVINSNGFLKVNKNVAKKLVVAHKYKPEPEDLFQAISFFKRAMKSQTAITSLNLNDAIKAEISDFLPHIFFRGMELHFLHKFVVPRAYIFSDLDEFSHILCDRDRFFEGKIKITNNRGQTLQGNVINDKIILRNIESVKQQTSFKNAFYDCYWNTKFQIHSKPCPLKIRENIEWYLVYYLSGVIGIERRSSFRYDKYLLSELTAGPSGLEKTYGCKIEIE